MTRPPGPPGWNRCCGSSTGRSRRLLRPLSLLDTQWPGHLPELVPALEAMGFHRYWASEHHSRSQSASPTLMAGIAAGLCDRMRVGTAGILLRFTSAVRVAEDFALLELFYSGRMDLGLAGGYTDGLEDAYNLDVRLPDEAGYADRLRRVVSLVRGEGTGDGKPVVLGPRSLIRPELWLCGTSARSARLAGSLGMRFAYHHYLGALGRGPAPATEIAEAYREAFIPHLDGDIPYLAVAAYGACAATDMEADREWHARFNGREPVAPSFVGTASACADRLNTLALAYGADELIVDCLMTSFQARLEALGRLAAAFR